MLQSICSETSKAADRDAAVDLAVGAAVDLGAAERDAAAVDLAVGAAVDLGSAERDAAVGLALGLGVGLGAANRDAAVGAAVGLGTAELEDNIALETVGSGFTE